MKQLKSLMNLLMNVTELILAITASLTPLTITNIVLIAMLGALSLYSSILPNNKYQNRLSFIIKSVACSLSFISILIIPIHPILLILQLIIFQVNIRILIASFQKKTSLL